MALRSEKIERDFPWLLREGHRVIFSGIGKGWRGWRQRGTVLSHAGLPSTGWLWLDIVLAWLVHFTDILRESQHKRVIGIAPCPEAGLGFALAKSLRRKVRLIIRVTVHLASKALLVHGSKVRFRIMEWIEGFIPQRADLVLPMGRFTRELAIAKGVSRERILMLPFPVLWKDSTVMQEIPSQTCVLFAGRLVKEKGVHVLLQAVSKIRERIPDVQLLIAGEGGISSIA